MDTATVLNRLIYYSCHVLGLARPNQLPWNLIRPSDQQISDIRSGEVVEDEDNVDLDAGDAIEVIDLDEVLGQDDEAEEDMDDLEEADEKLPEDNSDLVFNKHGSKTQQSCRGSSVGKSSWITVPQKRCNWTDESSITGSSIRR